MYFCKDFFSINDDFLTLTTRVVYSRWSQDECTLNTAGHEAASIHPLPTLCGSEETPFNYRKSPILSYSNPLNNLIRKLFHSAL